MTDTEIVALLSKRDKLLTRRDGLYDSKRVARIEAKLSTIAPGVNNEVDKALGRMCAKLEQYAPPVGWITSQAVTLELTAEQIAEMEARCTETATEPPTYDGMWM